MTEDTKYLFGRVINDGSCGLEQKYICFKFVINLCRHEQKKWEVTSRLQGVYLFLIVQSKKEIQISFDMLWQINNYSKHTNQLNMHGGTDRNQHTKNIYTSIKQNIKLKASGHQQNIKYYASRDHKPPRGARAQMALLISSYQQNNHTKNYRMGGAAHTKISISMAYHHKLSNI